jgi:uncharacterized membrane protein
MSEPKRLTAGQLTLWGVPLAVAVLAGTTLAVTGLSLLTQQRDVAFFQIPIGVILLVFGITMAMFIARQQRHFPRD